MNLRALATTASMHGSCARLLASTYPPACPCCLVHLCSPAARVLPFLPALPDVTLEEVVQEEIRWAGVQRLGSGLQVRVRMQHEFEWWMAGCNWCCRALLVLRLWNLSSLMVARPDVLGWVPECASPKPAPCSHRVMQCVPAARGVCGHPLVLPAAWQPDACRREMLKGGVDASARGLCCVLTMPQSRLRQPIAACPLCFPDPCHRPRPSTACPSPTTLPRASFWWPGWPA